MTAPSVTSVSPLGGALAGGTAVTIVGTGFDTVADVRFDGVSATDVVTVNATHVTCTTPAHVAGLVDVEVENGDAAVGTIADAFTYEAAPTIASVSPDHGGVDGGELAIIGTGFLPAPIAAPVVTVDGEPATNVEVLSATRVRAFFPPAAAGAAVDVVLTNRGGQAATAADAFTYDASAAVVSGYGPNVAPTTMTSDASAGCVTSGGVDAVAYRAFDGDDATFLYEQQSPPYDDAIQLDQARTVAKLRFKTYDAGYAPRNFVFQGSNDGAAWTDLLTVVDSANDANTWHEHEFANATSYGHYRLHTTSRWNTQVALRSIEFYEAAAPAAAAQRPVFGLGLGLRGLGHPR